ncbi:MAG: signal recognition particle-docking protein FtsY [Prochlorococcus sp.]
MVYDWFNRQTSDASSAQPVDPQDSEKAMAAEPDELPSSDRLEQDPVGTSSAEAIEAADAPADAGEVKAPATAEEDPLEWAREAYARLKAKQQSEQEQAEPEPELSASVAESSAFSTGEPGSNETVAEATETSALIGSDVVAAAAEPAVATSPQQPSPQQPSAQDSAEPVLGDFDDTFQWSADVLAAQGRQAGQVSLEEIDWLGRLRQGLEKTRQSFVTGLLEKLGDDPLTPEVVDDLETMLLRADAGVEATDQVLDALRKRMNEEVVDPAEGLRFLKQQLCNLLDAPIEASGVKLLAPERGRLNVWLMVGVNGVGKTTTLGKLANLAVRSGYSALIAAADTFRAAAVQQVQVWGDRSDVPVVANPTANADPAAVVFDAIGAARSRNTDLVLVDTAGRLQTKHNLMEELQKVRRIIERLAPEAKVESLLVLDASQGQNGLRQAMAFGKAAGLTGVVITKLDGTSRGGVALAVSSEAKLPIRFVGAGEGIRDLRPFNSFEFIEALLATR